MAQLLTVASVVSTGSGWSNGINTQTKDNVYAVCDMGVGGGTSGALKLALTNPTDPLSDVDHVISVQCKRINDDASTTLLGYGSLTIKVELRESGTLRATLASVAVPTTEGDRTYELTTGEAAAIANYANLELWLYVTCTPGVDGYGIAYVDYSELEIPSLAVPGTPTGVAASDGTYGDKVRVTCNSVSGATGYDTHRHTSNNFGASTKIDSNRASTTYDDTSATPGVTYYYWKVARNSAGASSEGGPNTGYRLDVPSAPTSVAATDGTYTDHVDVTWVAGDGSTSSKVLRDGVVIASGLTVLIYSDYGATPGTTHSYTVKGTNAAGDSAASTANTGYADAGTPPSPPAAVQNFSASDGAFQGKVRTSWDEFAGALSYEVYRSLTDFTAETLPATPYATGLTETSYEDVGVAAGQSYYYAAVAVTETGRSDPSTADVGSAATSSLRFFQEGLKALVDLGFKGTSSVAGLAAAPTVEFEALNETYSFDPEDAGYAAIAAGAKVGIAHSYDGTDDEQMTADLGRLWLADAVMSVATGADPARQFLVWSDHGAWEPLVCIQDAFHGNPFEVRGADAPTIQWSRLLSGLFRLAGRYAPGLAYPYFLEQCLYALLGGSARHALPAAAPTLKINFLTEDARCVAEHRFLADIPDGWFCLGRDSGVTLTTVATANVGTGGARVDADDPVFTAPATGLPDAHYALVHHHDADPEAALLALLLPIPTPIVFDSTNVTLQLSATAGLWQLGGA